MTKDQESGGASGTAAGRGVVPPYRGAGPSGGGGSGRPLPSGGSFLRPAYFLAGGDSEDLMQEGMFGLIKAMREYDPDRDASFEPLPKRVSATGSIPL